MNHSLSSAASFTSAYSTNTTATMTTFNSMLVEDTPEVRINESHKKYNNLLRKYELDIKTTEQDESKEMEKLTTEDLSFLQKMMKIKEKIVLLKEQYKVISESNEEINVRKVELENYMKNLIENDNTYNSLIRSMSFELQDDKLSHFLETSSKDMDAKTEVIRNLIEEQTKKYNKNEEQQCDLMEKRMALQKIISTDDVVEQTPSSQNAKPLCVICITRPIEYCMNKCGHSFCKECTDKIDKKCHCCRSDIYTKIKIFYD